MNVESFHSKAREAAALLQSLANEHRLMILCHLLHRPQSVSELEATLGLRQAALSQNLARLRKDGLVSVRRDGQHSIYAVQGQAVKAMISTLAHLFCPVDPIDPGDSSHDH
ncbi:ArsR/SmtB family transcription factor [Insolitispirillum peregrinum]|uniref:Transcriptional regulator, ArsR family n=1 Tax=Insolitispirillum peregrinum TaxID=80876 RepID=A0A1N7PJA9_9PROT|nr:metalloregulator ArsR/SmtB family transcription factor [Insolitispirillum peregrinum]SIT10672.1 transcriptional regulator, ArsR family [Insolitispirillum peregrinum]